MNHYTYQTYESMSAKNMGSGDLPVLSTPSLIALVENACNQWIKDHHLLTDEESSVGIHMDFSHILASPLYIDIQVVIISVNSNGKKHCFTFEVFDDQQQKIAYGTHQRAIVNQERFLSKVQR